MSLKKRYSGILLFLYGMNLMSCRGTSLVGGPSQKYVVSTQKVTWREAFVLCKQNGMELVSINSEDEHNAVTDSLENPLESSEFKKQYWTSGIRYRNDFVWFPTGKPVIYSNFAQGQPDNLRNAEDCIEIFAWKGANPYQWNDLPCTDQLRYICEVRN